jgi:hypothetical protein
MTNQNGVLKLHFRPTRANLAQLYLVHINVINRIQLDMNMASKFLGEKNCAWFCGEAKQQHGLYFRLALSTLQ